jgi:hypothetical protein
MDSDQQDMIAQFSAITGVNPSLVSVQYLSFEQWISKLIA